MGDTTHIRVEEPLWKELNRRKTPGDSFSDVIERLIQQADQAQNDERRSIQA